jgi:hypothetical protein
MAPSLAGRATTPANTPGLQRPTVLAAGVALLVAGALRAESPPGETLFIRLEHPDHQAAAVLRLFEGARASHPAAALAAWKRATREPGRLGKPLEAVIALFNPEMIREWSVFHGAELRIDLSAAVGNSRWNVVVPRDDGTVAALVTAQRLTGGGEEPPLGDPENRISVQRLGPPGAPVSAQIGDTLILGSSRDALASAIQRHQGHAAVFHPPGPHAAGDLDTASGLEPLDSGLFFILDATRLTVPPTGGLVLRRASTVLDGLKCRRVRGSLMLKGDLLALEVTTHLGEPARVTRPVAVESSWLQRVPRAGTMGFVSVAFEPSAAFWTQAFALADQVERAEPARAELAPLRARIDLIATAAGVSLEAHLWPHLNGFTAAVMGGAARPGIPTGALLVLHTDSEAAAGRLAAEVLPRLGAALTGTKRVEQQPGAVARAGDVTALGKWNGHAVASWPAARDVLIAWGDEALTACRACASRPEESVAPLCAGWTRQGHGAPQRVGAVWPARCLSPAAATVAHSPAWRTLSEDPPVIWWGWTEDNTAIDSVHFAGLPQRIHRFLEQVLDSRK